ncbi:MAG: 30S ribosomal protein S18 [Patescibacteria group bacterium]
MKSHSKKSKPRIQHPPTVRKQCHFCTTNSRVVNYKDNETLRTFMTPQARIQPRRRTGLCALHQRRLAEAIKHARIMAVVPFTLR